MARPATEEELKAAIALDAQEDESSDEEQAGQDEQPIETLVSGRAPRATAGNRMHAMISEVAEDDDLELLFADGDEDEPDEEFEEEAEDGGSDNDLGESSDDEDQGPAAGADDLDGEKEIEKQAKEERKRKRKAQQAFTKPTKKMKHVPIPGAARAAPIAKPKNKKVDRPTWLPILGEATRYSRRDATKDQSVALKARIVEREEERKQLAGKLEAAARKREEQRANVMTQEQHLAEAAQVEKENSKSLNRWEAMERERQEEQRARLAALQDRQLTGPVVSQWSGQARWLGDKLSAVGVPKIKEVELREIAKAEREREREEKQRQKEEKERLKAAERKEAGIEDTPMGDAMSASLEGDTQIDDKEPTTADTPAADTNQPEEEEKDDATGRSLTDEVVCRPKSSGSAGGTTRNPASTDPQPEPQSQAQQTTMPQRPGSQENSTNGPLPGLMQAAESNEQSGLPAHVSGPAIKQESVAPPAVMTANPIAAARPIPPPSAQPTIPQQIVFSVEPGSSLSTQTAKKIPNVPPSQLNVINVANMTPTEPVAVPVGPPPLPPKPEIAARNLVSLLNVEFGGKNDTTVVSSLPRELKDSVLVAKSGKAKKGPTKPPAVPICPVTGYTAKYKDPATGIGYRDSYAYKQLQNITEGRLRWSELAGCYISAATTTAAKGVPEGFSKISTKRASAEDK